MEKEQKCIRMVICILEITGKGCLTVLENSYGQTKAILKELL